MELVDCPVDLQPGVNIFGIFANAFRVVPETGEECFLDFCVFSAQENKAQVVSRLRIQRSFIPVLRERLLGALNELAPFTSMRDIVSKQERIVLCRETDE